MLSYISVDVETSGPNPSLYSLLSIGACTIEESPRTFYVELQPVSDRATPGALAISGLSMDQLKESGLEPAEAMAQFETWLEEVVPPGHRPLFVAFNAPFDWSFVSDYFHRFLGHNPFGHTALDIKALYMGVTGISWTETKMRHVAEQYLGNHVLTHHALQDALDQATIFAKLMTEREPG